LERSDLCFYQQNDASEVVDSGLNDSDIDEVEEERDEVATHVRKLKGLNVLPIVVF
jgi:hypothetical protein